MKKMIAFMLALTVMLGTIAGCSQTQESSPAKDKDNEVSQSENNNNPEKKEPIKMVLNLGGFLSDPSVVAALEEIQTLEEFSHMEFVILEDDADYDTKMPIAVASGEQMDIIGVFNSINRTRYAEAGTIIPMDDLADKMGIDFEEAFGSHAANAKIGDDIFIVPQRRSSWVLYYNKAVFDKAGMDYPDTDVPMTWDEYAALAAKLTMGESSNKTYGALHMLWPIFWYGEAIMALGGGDKFYNPEGLSNIEEPIFAKALERTYKMMHVDKSIPTHADMVVSKTSPQAFMNGQYGMMVSGSWVLNWSMDKETYPRDWKLGIAPMPVDAGTVPKTWGDTRGYGIPVTSTHPEEAMKVAIELARLGAKHAISDPASYKLEESPNLYVKAEEILVEDQITIDLLKKTFANPDTVFAVEKIMGKNNVDYDQVIKEESEKYFVKEQDLETTIKNIKDRMDKILVK